MTVFERAGLLVRTVDHDDQFRFKSWTEQRDDLSNRSNNFLRTLFLPERFPESVSPDYVRYQSYDSLQALVSNICSTFSTRAVLLSLGVGDATATATSAAVQWLLRDAAGHVGRVLFSFSNASAMDAESKHYRLLADVLNDVALWIDLLVPALPSFLFLPCVCMSSVFRAIVGVAGPATRAAVSVHQARANNVADVLAKDSVQETAVNLVGLVLSLWLVPLITEASHVWLCVVVLTAVHIVANVQAMCAVEFDTFNCQRLALFMDDSALTPADAARRETFVRPFRDAAFRERRLEMGASLADVLRRASADERSALLRQAVEQLGSLRVAVLPTRTHIFVCVADTAVPQDLLRGYFVARSVALKPELPVDVASLNFDAFLMRAVQRGWRDDVALLGGGTWRVATTKPKQQ
jgi:hypothetical protein